MGRCYTQQRIAEMFIKPNHATVDDGAKSPADDKVADRMHDSIVDATDETATVGVDEAFHVEAESILDRQARRYLHISGKEFVRRWKSGYWQHPDQVPGVISVSMLLPEVE